MKEGYFFINIFCVINMGPISIYEFIFKLNYFGLWHGSVLDGLLTSFYVIVWIIHWCKYYNIVVTIRAPFIWVCLQRGEGSGGMIKLGYISERLLCSQKTHFYNECEIKPTINETARHHMRRQDGVLSVG